MAASDDRSVRRLRRFFTPLFIDSEGQVLELPPRESRHLLKVIRLKTGDRCLLVDDRGNQAVSEILGTGRGGTALLKIMELQIRKKLEKQGPSFYVGIPQKARMDNLIEKAQELGVAAVIPMITEFTMVHPGEKADKMAARWNRLAREAAKQSGAPVRTRIDSPVALKDAMEESGADDRLCFFHPDQESISLYVWLAQQKDMPSRCKFFIGPEGGFSDSEIKAAKQKGAVLLSLGDTLLKVDTAFITAASAVQLFNYESNR